MSSLINQRIGSGDSLISHQMFAMGSTIQEQFSRFMKFFKNPMTNLVFQYFILKIISGIPFDRVMWEFKNMVMMFYNRYIKGRFVRLHPNYVMLKIYKNQAGANGRFTQGHNNAENTFGDLWTIGDMAKSILWKINKNTDKVQEMINTDSKYISKIITNEKGCATNIFIPNELFWFKLDEKLDIHIDIYDNLQFSGDKPLGSLYRETGTGSTKTIKVKSYTMNQHEIKTYLNKLMLEFNDEVANQTLHEQKIFIKKSLFGYMPSDLAPPTFSGLPEIYEQSPTSTPGLNGHQWTAKTFNTTKTWNTFFIEDKENLKSNLENILKGSEKEAKRTGRPTKRVILAYGESRCGKNSLFKILTKQIPDRHVLYIQPGSIRNFSDFEEVVNTPRILGIDLPPEKRIYQLDEIDKSIEGLTLVDKEKIKHDVMMEFGSNKNIDLKRKFRNIYQMENKKREMELSKWLTYIDGAHEDNNKILFLTAENITKLHPSFLKRVRLVEFKRCTNAAVNDIVKLCCKYDGKDSTINGLLDDVKDYKYTPSAVYDACENSVVNIADSYNNYKYITNALTSLIRGDFDINGKITGNSNRDSSVFDYIY